MDQFLRALRSLFSDDPGSEATTKHREAATDGGPPETSQFVHECPGCGEVYLSETPRRCSSCGETTVAVSSSGD